MRRCAFWLERDRLGDLRCELRAGHKGEHYYGDLFPELAQWLRRERSLEPERRDSSISAYSAARHCPNCGGAA